MYEHDKTEQAYKNGYEAGKKEAQAEIEMLKDLITYQKQKIKEKEQKYNQSCDDMFGPIETTRNEIAEAKSEAIKEFAERLKAKMIIVHKSKEGYCVYEFDDELIDNLVKEMELGK